MVLFGLAFVAVTIVLVVMQPGAGRLASDDPVSEPVVTRAEPALNQAAQPAPLVAVSAPAALSSVQPRQQVGRTATQSDLDDQSLRKMTWDTLSGLNHATGRDSAPGQPGSLLHTIVRRSLGEAPVTPSPRLRTATIVPAVKEVSPSVYVVQTGDSLMSIAEKVYGDINMTGPLFAANQKILSRPDDLRAGQSLILPPK
jgi:nucleoid-associated protein YgaU